jgi:DNA-binding transcriptional LysR family regulator
MELRHIRTFVAITEHGTLTAAAKELYKTQGAVSHDLTELERQLGLRLIDRSGQRIRLTPAGARLLPHAKAMLERMNDLEYAAYRLTQGTADVLRVGTIPSLSALLAGRLAEFLTEHPARRFSVTNGLPAELVGMLQANELDLVVSHPQLDAGLVVTSLGREASYFLVRGDSRLARLPEVTPQDVREYPLLGFIRERQATRLAELFFEPLGFYPPAAVEANDFHVLKQLVRDGAGVALLPASALIADGDGGTYAGSSGLRLVPPRPRLYRDIALLRMPGPTSEELRNFHDFLQERWRWPDPPGARDAADARNAPADAAPEGSADLRHEVPETGEQLGRED